jgi:hypothetical protein
MFRKVKLLSNLCFGLLLLSGSLIAQHAKPPGKAHPETSAGQRKVLDELTRSVSSHLPAGPVIPVPRRNYIDDSIFGKMEQDRIPHAGLSSDTEFLRRVTLDLTGRLPEVEASRSSSGSGLGPPPLVGTGSISASSSGS